ncbi:unnamed protein product [Brachionus calyciflorus]|uniref:Alpha/beta hydrolase fold-3 domain-containing protein n=1 Tax=Brachionus calyciflorus TaxID=104777 RepID=A0A814A9Z6_9BILA|nr:unnamed protein product [Brachionus calyciflorus]
MIIGGDSSGGNMALVLSQRLYERRRIKAKLQVLIYPWIQMFNLRLPSHLRYKPLFPTLNSAKIILWYLGFQQITTEMETFLLENKHTLLVKDQKLRDKVRSYLDVDTIPKKFKQTKSYYNNYANDLFENITDISREPLLRNTKFIKQVSKLVDTDLSPGLADIEILRRMPDTYMLVFEWDGLKDEQLIFAERLRLAGVPVNLVFNEEGFHGISTMLNPILGLKLPNLLLDNLVNYIQVNID